MSAYDLIAEIAPLERHFASPDYDRAIERLCEELDFTVHSFGREDEHNGWVLPPRYEVRSATISRGGEIIYDGAAHPLGVVCHSTSYHGTVPGPVLKQHCWYDHRYPEAIPYHFRHSYRPWERSWGFCMPRMIFDTLDDGEYRVDIEVEEGSPELKVLEYVVPGASNKEYVFCAHLDHPGMANDDLAGCAVGVDLFKQIRQMKPNFTYRLLLVQEIVGSQFYLNRFRSDDMLAGVFLEMLGVDVPLTVQQSYRGQTMIEQHLSAVLAEQSREFATVGFREFVGNDEIVFESHGVPMCSVTRSPYPEYHSSYDTIDIISKERLAEAHEALLGLVESVDVEIYVEKKFDGLFCLSNPRYDLYIDADQVAFEEHNTNPLRDLMEYLSVLPKGAYLADLCRDFGVGPEPVLEYLKRWEDAGLLVLSGRAAAERREETYPAAAVAR